MVLYFVGYLLKPHFYVVDFASAFWGALVISLMGMVLNSLIGGGKARIRIEGGSPPRNSGKGDDGPDRRLTLNPADKRRARSRFRAPENPFQSRSAPSLTVRRLGWMEIPSTSKHGEHLLEIIRIIGAQQNLAARRQGTSPAREASLIRRCRRCLRFGQGSGK
jgi:hypothetical protein